MFVVAVAEWVMFSCPTLENTWVIKVSNWAIMGNYCTLYCSIHMSTLGINNNFLRDCITLFWYMFKKIKQTINTGLDTAKDQSIIRPLFRRDRGDQVDECPLWNRLGLHQRIFYESLLALKAKQECEARILQCLTLLLGSSQIWPYSQTFSNVKNVKSSFNLMVMGHHCFVCTKHL